MGRQGGVTGQLPSCWQPVGAFLWAGLGGRSYREGSTGAPAAPCHQQGSWGVQSAWYLLEVEAGTWNMGRGVGHGEGRCHPVISLFQ